jgi:hypothetical protein
MKKKRVVLSMYAPSSFKALQSSSKKMYNAKIAKKTNKLNECVMMRLPKSSAAVNKLK